MRSSFWCFSNSSGASLTAVRFAGFIFVCVIGKFPREPGEKHQCRYRNGLRVAPIRSGELLRAKPIGEVRVRLVISLLLWLDIGLCSGEDEDAASSMARKTRLRCPRWQGLLAAGIWGNRSRSGPCPRATPASPHGAPPCKCHLLGFFLPHLLTSSPRLLHLPFFSKEKKKPSPSGFFLSFFNMDEDKILFFLN